MTPDLHEAGPVIDYLIKEVSYSTCDNKFFGELEKEMLIPNNINIYGKIKGATSLRDYVVRLQFPTETAVGYIKQPLSNNTEGKSRVLTYNLEELVNFDDYWWFPLQGETEFALRLNLLPPFPELRTVGLSMSCQPDVAVGLEADVTTKVRLDADENIDNVFLKLTAPMRSMPGVFIAITDYSDDEVPEPRQTVVSPRKQFPFPALSMKKGETLEYSVKTRIQGDPSSMLFMRCEQDILNAKLLTLSDSSPSSLPCSVTLLDDEGNDIPVQKTIRSTVLQATAQVMYSPFSVNREATPTQREVVVQAAT